MKTSSVKSEITVAAAVIVRPDGAFLMARKKTGLSNGGQWEFPGGKVESGETPSSALERELMEELNEHFRVSPQSLLDYSWMSPTEIIHFHFFVIQVSAFLPESRDHDDFTWILPGELAGLKLEVVEADKQALAFLDKNPGSYLPPISEKNQRTTSR